MILIFFMCFKLSILHLCVSDLGYRCSFSDDDLLRPLFEIYSNDKPDIFLITNSSLINVYNELPKMRFHDACGLFYNIEFGSKEKAKKMNQSNIIHFGFLDYNDAKLPKNFEYAGNVTKTQDVICNKTDKSNYFDCHEIANLVSSSIKTLNDGHIYNYVQKMEYPEYRKPENCKPFVQAQIINLTTVLLCMDAPIPKVNIKPLKLIIRSTHSCLYGSPSLPEWNDRFLAVLFPKPFEVFTEYLVPTIFYETPYIFSEYETAFPNSMNVVPWQLLKYGFLKFIQTVGWQRVLIVTDDSEYSLEFENELTALFNKERIVYAVIRCEDANCEMDKVKQELQRISAKIVIANVEVEHARYLVNHNPKITWILRDLAEHTPYTPSEQVFFISLRTVHEPEGCKDLDDNILTGLSSIALAYKSLVKEDFDVKTKAFYRLFADKAKQITTRKTEAIVVVQARSGKGISTLSTMYVDNDGAKLLTFPSIHLNLANLLTEQRTVL